MDEFFFQFSWWDDENEDKKRKNRKITKKKQIRPKKKPKKRSREKWDLLSGFDEGVGRHDHEDAIGEDGQNDEEGEERMNKDVDGHTPDGIERRQEPHGVRRAEPENIFAFADHHERLPRPKSKHTHTE